MYSHPVSDPIAWLRLLLGMGVVLVAPGDWLLGRFLAAPVVWRAVWSLAAGLMLACVGAAMSAHFGWPMRPLPYLAVLMVLGYGAGRWPAWRRVVATLWVDPDLPRAASWRWLALASLAVGAVVISIQATYPVPTAVHDAGNHAFLTLRIQDTGHTDAATIFGPPWAEPQRPYFVGWHTAAALIARVGGLPPYVACWLLSLLCVILAPFSLAAVWREWRIRPGVAALGAALLVVCGNILVEIPWRGGLGQHVALLALFVPTAVTSRAVVRGHAGLAIAGGVSLAGLVWIHGSWALIAAVWTAAACLQHRLDAPLAGGRTLLAVSVCLVVFGAVILWDVIPAAAVYGQTAYRPQPLIALRDSFLLITRTVGAWLPLQVLTVAGLALGLWRRRLRVLAVMSLGIAALTVGLASFQDPVSLWLGQPWYQIYFRLLRPQIFLLPPLVAALLLVPFSKGRNVARHRGLRLAVAVAVAAVTLPGLAVLDAAKLRTKLLFTDDDAQMARRLSDVVPADRLVANWRNDGSCWAMHISGRTFLLAANWTLGETVGRDYRIHIKEMLTGRLTPRVRDLREMGTDFVYATDHWMFRAPRILDRARLDAHPAFQPVLTGRHMTLYRIDWGRFRE